MDLTGDPGGPPLALDWPSGATVGARAGRFGLDASVLAERAAIRRLRRAGRRSCGGRTRLLRARDGWVALGLARDEDLQLLPALLGVEARDLDDAWVSVERAVADRDALELEEGASLLGACVSAVGRSTGPMLAAGTPRAGRRRSTAPLVVDLSTLWAGPLCTHLLQRGGAEVVKIEDPARPDGARYGPADFYDLLNAHKSSVALDLRSPSGRSQLLDLLRAADVVVTSARARAFEQLGISVDEVLTARTDAVWTAITAYGWSSNRVGYGDDVAAGAGLVAWHPSDGEPRFAADAIADPLCGLEAAARTLDCLEQGGRWFLDASLAGAVTATRPASAPATFATGLDGRWSHDGEPVARPRARRPETRARPLGADTEHVLGRLAA
jgi:crotonobetainyl-CoA:carnitine CoA-transferase CaiB-like acyl-CoA transferase